MLRFEYTGVTHTGALFSGGCLIRMMNLPATTLCSLQVHVLLEEEDLHLGVKYIPLPLARLWLKNAKGRKNEKQYVRDQVLLYVADLLVKA